VRLKTVAAFFPAGHTANAAYWLDDATGNWITSACCMEDFFIHQWWDFNDQKHRNLFKGRLESVYPIDSYSTGTTPTLPAGMEGAFKGV